MSRHLDRSSDSRCHKIPKHNMTHHIENNAINSYFYTTGIPGIPISQKLFLKKNYVHGLGKIGIPLILPVG